MSKFLEGWLFRPQGARMPYPLSPASKLAQVPWKFIWHEAWMVRYFVYANVFVTIPLYLKIDSYLTGPENTKLWTEKRKHDLEHHRKHMEKLWEVRT